MNWKLPNQLTIARIGLAGGFFALLGLYDASSPNSALLMNAAFVLYIVAGITDVLDGYFARKWNITSAFGRIADPFVDKVLVIGAFVMLAGRNFAMSPPPLPPTTPFEYGLSHWITGHMASAVQAWMVVVILSRELLVSAVRGYSESQGIKFAATPAGKIKMFVQSVAICTVLYQLANVRYEPWAIYTKIILVWLALLTTVVSGLFYLGGIRRAMRDDEHDS
jgi:CDP-diacylglycerol--glycerol-3-phosphate 3-phosphatidyltransferase